LDQAIGEEGPEHSHGSCGEAHVHSHKCG
jgi:hypothetical protein